MRGRSRQETGDVRDGLGVRPREASTGMRRIRAPGPWLAQTGGAHDGSSGGCSKGEAV
jgi:hypothetical protein